jgi:hypothetical protein
MKSWLRNDRVYQTIMNGALLVVFLAALSTGKWPQFGWVAGSITVIMVLVAAAVYSIAACGNDKENDAGDHISTPRKKEELAESTQQQPKALLLQERLLQERVVQERLLQERVVQERLLQERRRLELMTAALARDAHKRYEMLYSKWLQDITQETAANLILRNMLVHTSARAAVRKRAAETVQFTENATGRMVVTVGPVIIEIEEQETKVHITSPKTIIVTDSTDTGDAAKEPLTIARTEPSTLSRTVH